MNPISAIEPWDLVAKGYEQVTRPGLLDYSLQALQPIELKI